MIKFFVWKIGAPSFWNKDCITLFYCVQVFESPILFIFLSFLLSQLLLCEDKATFEMRKVVLQKSARSGTSWLRRWCVWRLGSLFPKKGPSGLSMVQECAGPCWLQLTGPPSGPGSCQDEENTPSGRAVTGADVVVYVRHSFHFARRAIDSPAGWH